MEYGIESALALIEGNKASKKPFLDLGNLGLKEIPKEVFQLTHLKKLSLGTDFRTEDGFWKSRIRENDFHYNEAILKNKIAIISSQIAQLVNLEKLYLAGNRLSSIENLTALKQLQELDLSDQEIAFSFAPLSNIKGLNHLFLKKNAIREICELPQLADLLSLDLSYNLLDELSHLSLFPKLQRLVINSNGLHRFNVLKGESQLSSLILNSNRIERLEGIDNLTELNKLMLSDNQIESFEILNQLQKLEYLNLSTNRIKFIKSLDGLTLLKELSLDRNRIENIPSLQDSPNLVKLNLSANRIENIEGLDQLSDLEHLNLGSNNIQKITGLDHLRTLKVLDLSRNKITDIQGLFALTDLQKLYLNNNYIEEIKGLKNLENLEYLGISYNRIRKIKEINHLRNLENLALQQNFIVDVEGLSTLPKLKKLNLSNNQIEKIDTVLNLPNLEIFLLNHNYIASLKGIRFLKKLNKLYLKRNSLVSLIDLEEAKELTHLYLSGNLIKEITGIESLKNLEFLDLQGNSSINDFGGLAGLGKLNKLIISDLPAQNFSLLYRLKKLEHLECRVDNNSLDLAKLTNLRELSLHINASNVKIVIEGNLSLQTLKIFNDTRFESTLIRNLPNLSALQIYSCTKIELIDLPSLKFFQLESAEEFLVNGLEQLVVLKIKSYDLTNYNFLKSLPFLVQLEIDHYKQEDLNFIDQLSALQFLKITRSDLTNIQKIGNLKQLEYLDLSNNWIEDIIALKSLKKLTTLKLVKNKIEHFDVLEQLPNLSDLNILMNPAKKLPDINQLNYLTNFYFDKKEKNNLDILKPFGILANYITDFEIVDKNNTAKNCFRRISLKVDKEIDLSPLGNCARLYNLSLRVENLEYLEVVNLASLERLKIFVLGDLKHLKIKDNPSLISIQSARNQGTINSVILNQLPNIERIEIGYSQLINFDVQDALPNLRSLTLISNQLSKLELKGLPELGSLTLSNNYFKHIPKLKNPSLLGALNLMENKISNTIGLTMLSHLYRLNLNKNSIEEIEELGQLTYLEDLDLSDNNIVDISSLTSLNYLKRLCLSKNKICKLSSLKNMIHLNNLHFSENHVIDLNPLNNLPLLKNLSLDNNKISNLAALASLKELNTLNVKNNQITNYPTQLFTLPKLRSIYLAENPIKDLPYEIVNLRNSLKDAKDWFRDLQVAIVDNYELKLMIVGNGRIGKTCIVNRLLLNTYNDQETSTHAIQLHQWKQTISTTDQEEKDLAINVWDFGGQEIYHSTHRLFMQSRALYLIVWDALMEKKLESEEIYGDRKFVYRNFKLPYWLEYIRSYSKKSPVMIVQNKSDRDGELVPVQQKVLNNIYQVLDYLSVSAKEGIGFGHLTQRILEIVQSTMPEVGQQMPLSWYEVKQQLLLLSKEQTDIPYKTFKAICQTAKVHHRAYDSLLKFLHNTGTVFYQKDLFNNRIILDQKWAIEAVYLLFDRQSTFYQVKKGIGTFYFKELAAFLDTEKYPLAKQKVIASFMESCEICFKTKGLHSDDSFYIAPELLPEDRPRKVQDFWRQNTSETLYFSYEHPILHRAFIQRFIVKAGRLTSTENLWRNGIHFEYEESAFLVEAVFKDYSGAIRIQTTGPEKVYLLCLIRRAFKDIYHYSINKLERLVAINPKDFVPLIKLLVSAKTTNWEYITAKNGQKVLINDLAYFLKTEQEILRDKKAKRLGELYR